MRITDWKYRKLMETMPAEKRRELTLYVPRKTMTGMEAERFLAVMEAYGREDLGHEALKAMEGE